MHRSTLAVIILLGLVTACRRGPEGRSAQQRTELLSQLATDSQQARLWRTAAASGAAAGLERVSVPETAVEVRQRVTAPSRPTQKQDVGLPAGIRSGVKLISAPALESGRFSGSVLIARVSDERVELDLGQGRTLAFFARARGGPLRISAGETAQLDLRVRDDPFDRQLILALQAPRDGVISVLEGGQRPVSVAVPAFRLTACQVGQAERGTMSVEVTVAGVRRTLTQGQIVDFPEGNLTVGLAASSAYVGADAFRAEGNPYSIDLIAWVMR